MNETQTTTPTAQAAGSELREDSKWRCKTCTWHGLREQATTVRGLLACPRCQIPLGIERVRSEGYLHTWTIVVQADSQNGAMDAVWACWRAWQQGAGPLSGSCPKSMGNRMRYRVEKTTSPNADLTDAARPGAGNNDRTSAGGVR